LGVNAVLRVESGIPQKFQALLITQEIPADPDQYFLWHESQKETNLTKYQQKRIDKDLEDARGKDGLKEDFRKEKYFDFQKVLLEDAPATFIYFPKYNVFYLSKAENKLNQILPLQFIFFYLRFYYFLLCFQTFLWEMISHGLDGLLIVDRDHVILQFQLLHHISQAQMGFSIDREQKLISILCIQYFG